MSDTSRKTTVIDGAEQIDLNSFMPYRIVMLGHEVSKVLSTAYVDEGLTTAEWRVLAAVGQADMMAARDVVALTPMDKMAVSRAVASLEEKNLVERQADVSDRRVLMLLLSPNGRTLYNIIAARALSIEAGLLATLDAGELKMFRTIIEKLEQRSIDDRNRIELETE